MAREFKGINREKRTRKDGPGDDVTNNKTDMNPEIQYK